MGSDINVIRSKLDLTEDHLSSASKTKPASDSSEKINIEMYGKLRECKNVEELCSDFDELSYIPTEHSLVCGTCVLHPFQIGANIPGSLLYDVANNETYKSTQPMSCEFRNLNLHIKTHF